MTPYETEDEAVKIAHDTETETTEARLQEAWLEATTAVAT